MCDSREDIGLDGRLQDEDEDEQRKKQESTESEERHLKHLSTVGAETGSDKQEVADWTFFLIHQLLIDI